MENVYGERSVFMKRNEIITLLKQHESEFREAGVGALFLFGSIARDQGGDASDVDLFFDLRRPQGFTLFDLVGLQERMQDVLGAKVDLMTRSGIHPRRRAQIEGAAVRVF
ncbi:MAG: nucleotidyltransferase family protein [Stellaceae bacterium]